MGMARLSVALLGPLQVTLDGKPVTTFEYKKVQALLAYLAVEAGQPHSRASLANLLWPDLADAVARRNLTQALSSIRQSIGHTGRNDLFLTVTNEGVQFNLTSDTELDLAEFNTLLAACDAHTHRSIETCTACAERLGRAATLYRGDFLAHFSLGDSVPFEEWAQVKRESLRQRALTALAHQSAYHERHGHVEQATALARRQLELDPWHEAVHRQIMRLLAVSGERHKALAHYRSFRRTLTIELEAQPEPETTALYDRLRAAEYDAFGTTGSRARTNNFPSRLETFIGRDQELAQIIGLLEQPTGRLITLTGPGGIGKTRLAIQAAQQCAAMFADGAYFVPFGPVTSIDFAVTAIASTLEIQLHSASDPTGQLSQYLRGKELLLVLDSVEHLLSQQTSELTLTSLIANLLEQAPRVSVLVTSRERLHLSGERLYAVPGLWVAPATNTDQGQDCDAVRLFVECARRADPAFVLTAREAPWVVSTCQLLGGMPLGIEMAAAWVRVITCAEIAQEVQHNPDFLQASWRDTPGRHSSLRTVFEHGWQLLAEEERQVVARLSVFRGGFEREAAEQAAGASLPILSELADKSWLQRAAGGRYDLHELLRQYALAKLAASGEEDAARRRHADYYCALAETAAKLMRTADQKRWLDRLEANVDNFRAALAWSQTATGDAEEGLRLACALGDFWEVRGSMSEGRTWLADGLDCAGSVSPAVRAKAIGELGWLALFIGDTAAARPAFEASLLISRTIGLTWCTAWNLTGLANIAESRRDYEAAQAMWLESLALFRQSGDNDGVAYQLLNLGGLAIAQGDYQGAEAQLAECREIFQQLQDSRGMACTSLKQGILARTQGDVGRAAALYDKSLALFTDLGSKPDIARVHVNQANLARCAGDEDRAEILFRQALVICRDFDQKRLTGFSLAGLAGVAAARGQPKIGARLLSAAARVFDAVGELLGPTEQTEFDRDVAAACEQLGAAAFAETWAEGQVMPTELAIAWALGA